MVLSSKDATNLKNVLKKVIKDATQEDEGIDDDEDIRPRKSQGGNNSKKLLNYDLQILQNWCAEHRGMKVTVAIQDTEAFDGGIMADLVSLLSAYLDRIPFVLLLGVATSVDIFHEKLPKSIIRLMKGAKFDVVMPEECLSRVFNDAILSSKSRLRLGATLAEYLLKRQKEHTTSVSAFLAALKYAYMAHFFGNALSILSTYSHDKDRIDELLQPEHFEAIRNLPSFRAFIEHNLCSSPSPQTAKDIRLLLTSDPHLLTSLLPAAQACTAYTSTLTQALEVLEAARACMSNQSSPLPRHELYPRALRGDLTAQSPLVRDLLLSIKKMNSASMLHLLSRVCSVPLPEELQQSLLGLKDEISALLSTSAKSVLTSEFDLATQGDTTLRATVVSKRVQLSEKKSHFTQEESTYSSLVKSVHAAFEGYFSSSLSAPPPEAWLTEIFFFDALSPHRDVFAPRFRGSVERALAHPGDYLGCECCNLDEEDEETTGSGGITPAMPPACILYKLYLESGPLVNTFDLWSAFWSIVGDEGLEDQEGGEGGLGREMAQALFYQGLAELKTMGFVKVSKRKTDHLAKLAWKGL